MATALISLHPLAPQAKQTIASSYKSILSYWRANVKCGIITLHFLEAPSPVDKCKHCSAKSGQEWHLCHVDNREYLHYEIKK